MRASIRSAIIGFSLVCTAPSAVLAVDDIRGAFGMKLGDALSDGDSRITEPAHSSRDAGLRYTFVPEHPFGALNQYYVLVTPTTGKIYRIVAEGTFQSASSCEGELLALQEALEGRYGPSDDNIGDAMVGSMTGIEVIRFGQSPRRIIATCVGVMREHRATLTYIDDDLESRAKVERARMGQGDYDGLGL
ncbi:MAG: hypothetical protein WED00_00675 [Aquisalimonadaceae bacterium]